MTTPILGIDELPASSSQPEVYVNAATRALEAFGGPTRVLDRNLSIPPGTPNDGDLYLVAGGGSGAWLGRDAQFALYSGTAWRFFTPLVGWLIYVVDEDAYLKYAAGSPTEWVPFP